MDTLRRPALALNLFYNFQTDFRHFTDFEVAWTYVYLAGLGAVAVVFALTFFQSTHMAFHCATEPARTSVCPNQFALCTCRGTTVDACQLVDTSGCTCCWYGEMELQSGLLYYLSHLGGFYTFSMGVSLAVLALVRALARPVEARPVEARAVEARPVEARPAAVPQMGTAVRMVVV